MIKSEKENHQILNNYQQYGVKSAKGAGKFWELSVIGPMLIERAGKIGDKGKQKKTVCPDRSAAHAQAEKLIAEVRASGFLMVPVKPLPDTDDEPSAVDLLSGSAVLAPAPEAWVALEEQFQNILQHVKKPYREELTEAFGTRFKAGAWAWPPVYERRSHSEIDRLGEVVLGPLFTCSRHEWPVRDGKPMAPLIQLDLACASKLSGVPLGDGLVQVWMPHKAMASEDLYLRVVPREVVRRAELTQVPAMPLDLEPLQCPETPDVGFQITDWGQTHFTTPLVQSIQGYYSLKKLTSNAAVAEEVQAFDQTLKALVQGKSAPFSPVNTHLFGTFGEVQYAPQDKPHPLFCFDGEDFGLAWGDGGNAQLFFTCETDGTVKFSFDWSCH